MNKFLMKTTTCDDKYLTRGSLVLYSAPLERPRRERPSARIDLSALQYAIAKY
jgi:hypothetical protein